MATRIVPFAEGMKIGLGYDRLTGDHTVSPAVEGKSISPVEGGGGELAKTDCTTIKDVDTLNQHLGINVDAGGSYMGFKASAKVTYLHDLDSSHFSTYVVVRVTVVLDALTIDSPVFSPDANDLLVNSKKDRFRQRFADCFISGVLRGGEYYATFQITSSDEKEREDVSVNVHSAFDSPTASGKLNIDIETAKKTSKSHLEVSCHVYRDGALAIADLNVEDVMQTARNFPVALAEHARTHAVLLNDYNELKLPVDTFPFIAIQNQQEVLETLAKTRFAFLELRDDFKYVLKHIDDFENSDGTPVARDKVSKDFDEVIDEINSMAKLAEACAKDAEQCEFPKFDVAKFNVPRLKNPRPLRVLDLLATENAFLRDALHCLSLASIDECIAGIPGVFPPSRAPREMLEFLDAVRKPPFTLTVTPEGALESTAALIVGEQSPQAGTLVSNVSELTLNFIPLPGSMLDLVGEFAVVVGGLFGCIVLTPDFEAVDHCLEFNKDDLVRLKKNDARKLAEFLFFVTRNKVNFNMPRIADSNVTIQTQFPPAGSRLTTGMVINFTL